ncbi:hypothetical protein [Sphingomonas montana]|uniref:hypothetical protein n=1 Tax=Sphingomonas montana TaxID=1843236 RepID=UPI00096D87CE|nr:hypothetical protein [Sphingomonas montana]
MPHIPPRLSLADVADRTRGFVRREAGLLLPLAFATTGLATLLWDLAAPTVSVGQRAAPGPWLLVLFPVTLLFLIGNMAVAALVVTGGAAGGVSVRDALRVAVDRLGNALLVLLLFLGAALVLTAVVSVIAILIGRGIGWPAQQATSLALLLILPAVLVAAIRLLTLWPAIAARAPRPAPVQAVRDAFATTRGLFSRLVAVTILYALAYMLILGAIEFGLGSVLLLVGRATGQAAAMGVLLSVVGAMAGAAVQAVWGVFAAFLYLSVTADSSGT